jgi:translocation and assembly module TamB
MKRVLLILLPPLIVLAALAAGLKYWAIPAGEAWALTKLKSYSEKHLPVIIEAESIKFNILKNAAAMEKITITTKNDLKKYTDRANIESIKVNLDLFQLFTGRVLVSAVLVDSPEARVQLDPILDQPSKPEALPLNQLFELLEKIPVERVFVHNLNLELQSQKQKSSAHLNGADVLVGNHGNSLTARLDVPRLNLVVFNQGPIETRFDISAVLGRDNLRITRAGARYGESELIVKGEFDKFSQVALTPRATLEANGNIKFQEIMQQIRPMFPNYKLPAVMGEATTRLDIKINGKDQITGKMDLKTKDVSVDHFTLGNATVQGVFKGNSLIFPEVQISHPAGTARLVNSEIELKENLDFKTTIKVSKLDLQKLFVALNLREIPVWLTMQGDVPCSGQIKAPFKVVCDGSISGENLLVTSDFKNKNAVIADIAKMSAKGQAEITEKAITYKAHLTLGPNTGESSGIIDFAKGFNIAYSSPRLDFTSIRNLANLKFKGYGSLEGTTKGDSYSAVFDMKMKLQDFTFEDYYLGQLNGTLSYVKSHLLLNDLSGFLPKSSYQGSLDVDLHDSRIVGRIKAPTLELSDLVKVFEGRYLFPLAIKAPGSADIAFNGPLDFWKLSYQLDSKFKGGQFAGESFDELILNAQSTQGNMQIQKAFLRKNAATITAAGGITTQQDLNLKVEGKNFRLDESDFISKSAQIFSAS